jgi:hypothetical protein
VLLRVIARGEFNTSSLRNKRLRHSLGDQICGKMSPRLKRLFPAVAVRVNWLDANFLPELARSSM